LGGGGEDDFLAGDGEGGEDGEEEGEESAHGGQCIGIGMGMDRGRGEI
jgi:hypothetical protein